MKARMTATRIQLRGQALKDFEARHRANRKPPKHLIAAQAAAVARWGSDAQQGESRMDRKEGQNL
jgi:hypothetical protein